MQFYGRYGVLHVLLCCRLLVLGSRPRRQNQDSDGPSVIPSASYGKILANRFSELGASANESTSQVDESKENVLVQDAAEEETLKGRNGKNGTNGTNGTIGTSSSNRSIRRDLKANHSALLKRQGFRGNQEMDWPELKEALVITYSLCILMLLLFSILRVFLPSVYSYYAEECPSIQGCFDWMPVTWAITWHVSDVQDLIGLDHALTLDYFNLCVKVCIIAGVPNLLCGPLYMQLGEGKQGTLNKFDVDNLPEGSPVHIMAIACIWVVVVSVCWLIHDAYKTFLGLRMTWLHATPNPQACTLLVEGIPTEYRRDDKLHAYFSELFSPADIECVHVVRNTLALTDLVQQKEDLTWRRRRTNTEDGGAMAAISREKDTLEAMLEDEVAKVERAALTNEGDVCSDCGFVTFTSVRAKTTANYVRLSAQMNAFKLSTAPDPGDIKYVDLQNHRYRFWKKPLGNFFILLLFVTFLPIVTAVTSLTDPVFLRQKIKLLDDILKDRKWLQELLQSVIASFLLGQLIGTIPYLLSLISRPFLRMKARGWYQRRIQDHFFIFQIVFVLLVTTLGGSLMLTLSQLQDHPREMLIMLARNLPEFSHFYQNYVVLETLYPPLCILRGPILFKLVLYYTIYGCGADGEDARLFAEPEDPSTHGIGARMAQASFHATMVMVYCTTSPFITLVALPLFFLKRLCYGYLMVFAETRKTDFGGAFWREGLEQLFIGLLFYTVLMTGVIINRAPAFAPLVMLTVPYVLYWHSVLHKHVAWKDLPLENVVRDDLDGVKKRQPTRLTYKQPELLVDSEIAIKSEESLTREAIPAAVAGLEAAAISHLPSEQGARVGQTKTDYF